MDGLSLFFIAGTAMFYLAHKMEEAERKYLEKIKGGIEHEAKNF
jgi:hypothetical protein